MPHDSNVSCCGRGLGQFGKAQPERGALAWFTDEVDCTTVQLNHPESGGEADPGSIRLGSEVQIEDLFARLVWNSAAGIRDEHRALRSIDFGTHAEAAPGRA